MGIFEFKIKLNICFKKIDIDIQDFKRGKSFKVYLA